MEANFLIWCSRTTLPALKAGSIVSKVDLHALKYHWMKNQKSWTPFTHSSRNFFLYRALEPLSPYLEGKICCIQSWSPCPKISLDEKSHVLSTFRPFIKWSANECCFHNGTNVSPKTTNKSVQIACICTMEIMANGWIMKWTWWDQSLQLNNFKDDSICINHVIKGDK